MAGRIQFLLTISIAIFASFIGYLAYAPNSENIPQLNRLRLATASMKLAHLIVC